MAARNQRDQNVEPLDGLRRALPGVNPINGLLKRIELIGRAHPGALLCPSRQHPGRVRTNGIAC
jgi:hypothetical protein